MSKTEIKISTFFGTVCVDIDVVLGLVQRHNLEKMKIMFFANF
jgi:hypothetical protein